MDEPSSSERMQLGRDLHGMKNYGTTDQQQQAHLPPGVEFTCTDHGTHDVRRFGTAVVTESGAVGFHQPLTRRLRDLGRVMVLDDRRRFQFDCPSCPRDDQFTNESMVRIVALVSAAGLTSVDLSALPANLSSS